MVRVLRVPQWIRRSGVFTPEQLSGRCELLRNRCPVVRRRRKKTKRIIEYLNQTVTHRPVAAVTVGDPIS